MQDRSINSEDAICINKTLGMLFQTYSEMDLEQLLHVFLAIDVDIKIDMIDPESILCTFEGHSIFSIFWD